MKSVEEAVEWNKRAPFGRAPGQPVPEDMVLEIEIRPIYDQADLERDVAAQRREKEAQLKMRA